MIPAGGIQDQQLTMIVLMMLIELALLRLSRAAFFKHLLLLGHGRGVALHPRARSGRVGR
jgi:hypothetical protein